MFALLRGENLSPVVASVAKTVSVSIGVGPGVAVVAVVSISISLSLGLSIGRPGRKVLLQL